MGSINPIILHAPHIAGKLGPAERKSRNILTGAEAIVKHAARLEKDLQKQISDYLRLLGIWFDQDAMHKRRTGTKSAPDFLLCYRGKAIGIEAKTATGSVRPDQQQTHIEMSRNGWIILVARSLADVQGLFRAIDKAP